MPTPREVIEGYLGGDHVEARDLKASVATLLAGWDAVVDASMELAVVERDGLMDAVAEVVGEACAWGGEVDHEHVSHASLMLLPAFLQARACGRQADAT